MRASKVLALIAVALVGCTRGIKTRAQVEALFDVPREYRVLSALPCAEGAALVYVVAAEGDLYSFEPDQLTFKRIGALSCPARYGATPNSMAVDRSGTAWINYTDGTVFRASTRDASCSATDMVVGQRGFGNFGMAFVSTGEDLTDETLFVWGGHEALGMRPWPRDGEPFGEGRPARDEGIGLARIDRSTLEVAPIGHDDTPLARMRADLTGTGDGRLFGFFATQPAVLAEIDVHTGATRDARRIEGVTSGSAWAFSAWGGAFWLYWAPFGRTSRVTRLDADGTTSDLLTDIGFRIVGAGVSTCAPTGRRSPKAHESTVPE